MTTTIDTSVINAINGGAATTASERQKAEDLRSNFMTLLVTQLQNQDPLKPMENAEMTSQLAQVNTLSGIEELNETLQGITGQIDAGQTLQASALIGRNVLVPGDRVLVGNGTATPFGIELAAPVDQAKVSIYDGSGQLVRQFELGALDAGVESFVWDGTLDDGSAAPDGAYRVAVEASADEQAQQATVLSYAQVGAISTGASGPLLDLGATLGRVGLQNVRQIL
ncbi:flagellar hook assembly protein FlgD [Pseudomonas sp. MAP12]|uniref:Basal-body rod modification protein FlgD n=1 Tax=Geopseudomonas aromaticivorans TaxID=2849492 RepID=A0ABS6MTW1_9GAMM|nr:flagellar hook assembly protein FlgD [Pseudomonas aromaticivorans]MBV2132248.1 flagellar hook assembly protein FlgD [Pseudomonas aromaticivorans]